MRCGALGRNTYRMSDYISVSEFHADPSVSEWRVVGDGASAYYPTGSFSLGARLVATITAIPGIDAHPPDIDLRDDGVTVRLLTMSSDWYGVSKSDVSVAAAISAAARSLGLAADPSKVQSVLIVPGATDVGAVMPFWQAMLGYSRRPDSPEEDLVDPRRRGPAFWFERMQEPRRDGLGAVHVAVWVPYEQAEARVAAAIAAGGRVVRDEFAPMWWTLADAAGNEADISTPKGRD
jgi:4a-hydroxytetrahydrobiopterin dehydratase